MQQIKLIKEQIKERKGKNDNDLINKNRELEKKLYDRNEQIDGMKVIINKLTDEREKIIMNQNQRKNSSNNNIKITNDMVSNDKELKKELKDAKIIINDLSEKIKKLEEENNNIKQQKEENKMMDSEYKSEGEEEYTMKKMVNAIKKRNQSEDIKIDYPGLNDVKQKYDELEPKFRKLEENILSLLSKFKCNEEIKPEVIDICNTLELGDDMVKQILSNK